MGHSCYLRRCCDDAQKGTGAANLTACLAQLTLLPLVSAPSFHFVNFLRGTGHSTGQWGASGPPCTGRSNHGRRRLFCPPWGTDLGMLEDGSPPGETGRAAVPDG